MIKKIKGRYVIGYDGNDHEIICDGEVVFENEKIIYVGKNYEGPVDEIEDVGNSVVMPGFIDLNALGDIDHDILHFEAYDNVLNSLWPSEEYFIRGTHERMSPEEEAFKSKYAYAQLIRNGITTALPITSVFYKGWAETYEEAEAAVEHAGELGLRIYMSPSYQCGLNVTKPDGNLTVRFKEGEGEKGLERAVKFVKKYDGAYNGLVRGCLKPERIEMQTEDVLKETRKYATELGCPLKLHAAQSPFEYEYIKQKTGKSPVEYLEEIGFLGKDVGIPHAFMLKGTKWVSDEGDDLSILEKYGTSVIHCPIIIGRTGRHLNTYKKYCERGVNVAIGTDTFPPDFFGVIRTASMYSRMQEGTAKGSTYADIYRSATLGGAKMLGREDLGRLCEGAKADMIVVDLDSFHMGTIDDPIRTIFMCGNGTDVKMSIINGKTVMKDRKLINADLEELRIKGQTYFEKMKYGYMERDYQHLKEEEIFRPSYPIR